MTQFSYHGQFQILGHVTYMKSYSWQNGTRRRNSVKVVWYDSHLVWLVFEDSIPVLC